MLKLISAVQIANWFIQQSLKEPSSHLDLTPLKLQYLLYYAQCRYLSETGAVLFPEDMEARDCGPVIPVVEKAFQDAEKGMIAQADPALAFNPKGEMKEILEKTLQSEGKLNGDQLFQKIVQETPWKKAYMPGRNNILSILDMEKIFPRKQELQEWVEITEQEADEAYRLFYMEDREVLDALSK